MCLRLLILVGLTKAISAQVTFGDFCDGKIMKFLANRDCHASNETAQLEVKNLCSPKCGLSSDKGETEDQNCCMVKCIIDHLLLSDGKVNKTAMVSLYGADGDSKLVENVGECEEIIAKNSSSELYCEIPMDVFKTIFCTSWMSLVKSDHTMYSPICLLFHRLGTHCFDFYNKTTATSAVDTSNTLEDDTLIVAVNLIEDPCNIVIDSLPEEICISKNFAGWRKHMDSCSAKCTDGGCCLEECMFIESEILVEKKLNKSLLSSWLNKAADPQDPEILGYIEKCEAIVKLFTNDAYSCGVPFPVIYVVHCTIWIYHAYYNTEGCEMLQDTARKCFNLKNETWLTTTTDEVAVTPDLSTSEKHSTKVTPESLTESSL